MPNDPSGAIAEGLPSRIDDAPLILAGDRLRQAIGDYLSTDIDVSADDADHLGNIVDKIGLDITAMRSSSIDGAKVKIFALAWLLLDLDNQATSRFSEPHQGRCIGKTMLLSLIEDLGISLYGQDTARTRQ